jgi:hypothetical protein
MKYGKFHIIIAAVSAFLLQACQPEVVQDDSQLGAYQMKVSFKAREGAANFSLNTDYVNAFGESYRVSKFLYYVSNMTLLRSNGATPVKLADSYYLVSMADAASQIINTTIPVNDVTGVQFLLGVDSLRNVSGAQAGALDPMNGMFWTWSTGYIMAKLEGSSPASTQPSNAMVYHIGGFAGANNATRWVTLNFPAGKPMNINRGGVCELQVDVAVNKWFNGVYNMKIADFAGTMSPGGQALKIADNYATMFSITDVINR